MVVLEDNVRFSSMNNQYFQQDYLSPLPTTLDTKKSPLALLAQTCSQIGADTPLSKSLVSGSEKSRKPASENTVSPSNTTREKSEKTTVHSTTNLTTENKLVFKPYEHNVLSKKIEERQSPIKVQNSEEEKREDGSTLYCGSVSPTTMLSGVMNIENSKTAAKENSTTPSAKTTSPLLKPDEEILQEHVKDISFNSFKPALSTGVSTSLDEKFNTFCPTSRFENTNPAFRPPFPGAALSPHQHAAMFSIRDPGTSLPSYLNYSRIKTICADDPEVVLSACKDPYCTGCQFNLTNQLINKGSCPSGCTQCDHQKYRYAMAMSLFPPGFYHSPLAYTQFGHYQICNWILGDTYCGKRFLTPEELLQHLQTHTNGADLASLVTSSASPLLNANFGSNAVFSTPLHRPIYTNSQLSPLSTSRYHPYGKPIMPISLPPYEYSVFNPMPLSYYSAYSGQGRSDATAVHL